MANLEHTPTTPDNGVDDAVDAMGNSALKMLTMTVLASRGYTHWSHAELANYLNDAQGEAPRWKLTDEEGAQAPMLYCRTTLAPAGLATLALFPEKGCTRPIRHCMTTEKGLTDGLATAAALMEWELAHPGHSLREILGATGGGNRSRTHSFTRRLALYGIIIDRAETGATADVIPEEMNRGTGRNLIRKLIRSGILRRSTREECFDGIEIAPDYEQPITELLGYYRMIKESQSTREYAGQRALSILSTPKKVAALMRKAKYAYAANVPDANPHWDDIIPALLQEPRVSIAALYERYLGVRGRDMTFESFRDRLKKVTTVGHDRGYVHRLSKERGSA